MRGKHAAALLLSLLLVFAAVHIFFVQRVILERNMRIEVLSNFVAQSYRYTHGGGAVGALLAWPLYRYLGFMAKVQFVPALLALNVIVVVALMVLTWVFGRIYCSVVCPLGVFQDMAARIGHRGRPLPYDVAS